MSWVAIYFCEKKEKKKKKFTKLFCVSSIQRKKATQSKTYRFWNPDSVYPELNPELLGSIFIVSPEFLLKMFLFGAYCSVGIQVASGYTKYSLPVVHIFSLLTKQNNVCVCGCFRKMLDE